MKIYNKLLLVIITGLVLSCGKEFLELTPQQSVSASEALTNLEDYKSSITGVYNQLQSSDYYGRYMFLIPDVMSDDVKQNDNANRIIFYAEHVVNLTDVNAEATWTEMYQSINALNNIINANVEVPASVKAEQDHIIGEAYALRGLVYFDIVRFFGQHYTFTADASHPGVPIILTFDPTNKPARNTVNEVYDQAISDMNTAIALLQPDSRTGNSNTLTPNAVKALLARVYLYKEDWPMAEQMATEVINSGNYLLIPNSSYLNLWTTDNSVESIFEISMTSTDNVGAGGISGLYLPLAVAFGDYLPSDDVVSLYDPADARLSVFVVDPTLAGVYAPFRVHKYPDPSGSDNPKVIRLAELYLIRAEARAEIGTNEAGARQDLDMVRQRALPSAPNNTDTGQALKDAIMLERRLELCFEGQRLWDLMRKKQDIVRTQCTSATCSIAYGSNSVIMPIPQVETDTNPNIAQNPGY